MDLKKHYLMTFSALFFLGLIVAKPGDTFSPNKDERVCNWAKGKLECEKKLKEYDINNPVVKYHYR